MTAAPPSRKALRIVFAALAVLNIIVNLDGGGVPAALTNIQYTFELSAAELGILGALVYVGQASGALICGPLLKKFSATRVCTIAIWTNTAMTVSAQADTHAEPPRVSARAHLSLIHI